MSDNPRNGRRIRFGWRVARGGAFSLIGPHARAHGGYAGNRATIRHTPPKAGSKLTPEHLARGERSKRPSPPLHISRFFWSRSPGGFARARAPASDRMSHRLQQLEAPSWR